MSRPRPRNNFAEPDVRPAPVFIYGLREVGTEAVRYVGRSSNPESRLAYYLTQHTSVRVAHWTRAAMRGGGRIEVVVLRTVPVGEDAARAELETIRALEAAGAPLLNYHGMRAPLPKLYGKRDRDFAAECAELGIYWGVSWTRKKAA